MTDKPEPTAEHIDAVTVAAHEACHYSPEHHFCRTDAESGWAAIARAVLTSTEPAVHAAQAANLPTDAMLTALVERGALTQCENLARDTDRGAILDPFGGVTRVRRFVTPWEPTP